MVGFPLPWREGLEVFDCPKAATLIPVGKRAAAAVASLRSSNGRHGGDDGADDALAGSSRAARLTAESSVLPRMRDGSSLDPYVKKYCRSGLYLG
jgi:hypothetical protein